MSDEEPPTSSGGIEPHRRPYHGVQPSDWQQKRWRRQTTTSEMRDAIRRDAEEIREKEPDISKSELGRRLAVKYNITGATARYYI